MKYVFFDGDNVGSTIEILLIENKIIEAQKLSKNISIALKKIETYLEDKANILILGGDDILIEVKEDFLVQVISEVQSIFKESTGLTISGGIGNSVKSSIYQLSLAKLYGKNQIKSEVNV